MSCSNSEKNRVGREEGEQEQNQHVLRGSVEKESRAVVKNGSIKTEGQIGSNLKKGFENKFCG